MAIFYFVKFITEALLNIRLFSIQSNLDYSNVKAAIKAEMEAVGFEETQ